MQFKRRGPLKKLIIPVLLIILCSFPTVVQSQVLSLWTDESMSSCQVYVDQYETYTFYVFLEPPPVDGAFAVEYMIQLPDSHICVESEPAPFAATYYVGSPVASPGISLPFRSCQNSTVWIFKHTVFLYGERDRNVLQIEKNEDSDFLGVAICNGNRPLIDATVYNHFGVNLNCAGISPPWLESAWAVFYDEVAAEFDGGVYTGPGTDYFEDHFKVYAVGCPPATLNVIDGEWLDDKQTRCLLQLDGSMDGIRTYRLVATDISGGHNSDTSEQTFICPIIASQLQQFSAALYEGAVTLNWQLSSIDPEIIFHISRREALGPFVQVGEVEGKPGELSYVYEDRSAAGGMTYIYRVAYVSGSDRGILFETDAIWTAPVPLTLAQNHPNPFNPSTTIEFYLPESGQVTLRVFDVSGRLVRTLVDDAREPGNHSVTWNGLDENGSQVPSGVYFSQLNAGKTRLSQKMILLR